MGRPQKRNPRGDELRSERDALLALLALLAVDFALSSLDMDVSVSRGYMIGLSQSVRTANLFSSTLHHSD